MKSPQSKVKEILPLIQILYQNDEISIEQKNTFTSLLSEARRSNDFSQLNKLVKQLAYGTTMPGIVENLIELTSQ